MMTKLFFVAAVLAVNVVFGVVIPTDYAPVEFVEATGTQHVKTFYTPNDKTRVVAEYQLTKTGQSDNYIFGMYSRNGGWNSGWYFWFSHAAKANVGYPGTSNKTKTLTYDLNRHTVDFNCGTVAVDGTDLGLSMTWTPHTTSGSIPCPFYLFARNTRIIDTVENLSSARIYSFKIYEGSKLVLDFVPVVRVADSNPGFYDRISKLFYGSAVSDKLVAGDYVSLPDDYFEIAATPDPVGAPSPAYGTNTSQSASMELSTTAEVTRPDGVTKVKCTGWKSYRLDATTHVWTQENTGTDTAFTYTPPAPAAPRMFVWQYDSYTLDLTSGDHGAISYDTGFHKDGEIVSVSVVPDAGYAFYKWDVEEGSVISSDTNILLKGVVRAQAVFAPLIELSPGTDVISSAIATRFADAGDVPTVFRLAEGNYIESGSNHAIWLTNAYHVVGGGVRPEDVAVTRNAASANVFYLDNADAEVRNMTIRGGYGATNKQPTHGGNIAIGELGGTVIDCVIANGTASTYNSAGGNIYMVAGLVSRCVVTNGYLTGNQGSSGGGICASGTSRIENCLIGWNKQRYASGTSGVALYGDAELINCTVVANGNNVGTVGGVKANDVGTKVINCAIYDNLVSSTGNDTWGGWYEHFINCASSSAINGYCVGTEFPAFKASATGDYSLTVASPLRNAGYDYARVSAMSTTDLKGSERVSQSAVDIGAYEFVSSGMSVDFTADIDEGLTPHRVTFTATVEGAKGAVEYKWDFDGDGTDDETTSVPYVTHEYTLGNVYSVNLTVSDGSSSATASHADMIKTCQKDVYVASTGSASDEYPYASWETASDDIQDAINAAVPGCVVHIAAGDYPITAALSLKKAIRIEGATGIPADVLIRATSNGCRAMYVDAAGSMIANCTLKSNFYSGSGRVILVENSGGAISNCVVNGDGTLPVYSVGYSSSSLLFATRTLVSHVLFTGYCKNHLSQNQYGPTAASISNGSTMENSLVSMLKGEGYSNEDNSGGSVIRASSGSSVVNCTVVNCTNAYINACVFNVDATSAFTNCVTCGVVYTNNVALIPVTGTAENLENCAFDTQELPNLSCLTICKADFKNYANGDYRPVTGGGLFNKGIPVDAPATDLAGKPRVVGKSIDIGCYEQQSLGGLQLILR